MLTEIEKVQRHAKRIATGKDPKVHPGKPARFTDACVKDDAIWQGDLALVISGPKPPKWYVRVDSPQDQDRQLVPGNTVGAKHCLDSLDGVTLYRPSDWNEESLDGPYIQLSQERTILHRVDSVKGAVDELRKYWDYLSVGAKDEAEALLPIGVHGAVTIPAGFSVQCYYQREWDREQAKERRARD